MAVLPTNYVDDILDSSESTRRYNIVDNADGTKSFQDATTYQVTGTEFGASDFNATNTQVNANTSALGGISFSYNATDGHFYATDGKHSKKLGSSEGSATTEQVLLGTTFGSSNYDDVATGTMPNNGAISKVITPSTAEQTYTVPKGYHDGAGQVTIKKVEVTTPSANQILKNKKVTVKSNSVSLKTVTGTMNDYTSQTIAVTSASNDKANITVVPEEGYYDGSTSKVAIPQSAICNVVPLGEGTSFNIKSLLPTVDVSSLTVNNFIVDVKSISVSGKADANFWNTDGGYTFDSMDESVSESGSSTIAKSYNSSTGVLTISGTGASVSKSKQHASGVANIKASVSASASCTVRAYLILGGTQ